MSDLPDPFTPPDANITDFSFTPIFRSRLFASSFHARSTDAEWRAGLTLWLKSWDQVPAGSLPDDDIDLCHLAELGRDMKSWLKVKQGAMRGWVKCSDGLLYHETVAEGVNEAWQRRLKQRERGAKGAAGRWNKHGYDMLKASDKNALSIAKHMLSDGKGQGQEVSKKDTTLRVDGSPSPDPKAALWKEGLAILKILTKQPDGPARKLLGRLVDAATADHTRLLALIHRAEVEQPDDPVSWLLAGAKRAAPGAPTLFDANSLPEGVTLNPKGEQVVNGYYIDYAADEAVHAAHFNMQEARANWRYVIPWLQADIGPDVIKWAIKRVADKDGYIRPSNLAWFDGTVRAAARRAS